MCRSRRPHHGVDDLDLVTCPLDGARHVGGPSGGVIDRLPNRNVSTAGGLTRHTGPVPFMLVLEDGPRLFPSRAVDAAVQNHQHRGAPCMRRRLPAFAVDIAPCREQALPS